MHRNRNCLHWAVCLGFAAVFSLAAPSPVLAQSYLGVDLRPFAVFGGTTVTCNGVSSITGNVGVAPGTATTGFPVPCAGVPIFPPASNAAKANLTAAYLDLAGRTCTSTVGPNLAGLTLTPGIYCVDGAPSNLTGTLLLNAQNNPAAEFVFKMSSSLITSSNSIVSFINGNNSNACGVQWQVSSSATLNTGTTFVGNILALTNIEMHTGANLTGRALARNAAVTLDGNAVSFTACGTEPTPIPTLPEWAMIGLMFLLAAVGLTAMRRRTA